jgi:PAS domain S-box-containing protein
MTPPDLPTELETLRQENRRLALALEDNQRERRQASALQEIQHQVLERIARGEDLGTVLEALVRLAEVETGMLASVLLVEQGRLRHGAAPSLPAAYNAAIDGIDIGPGVGSCGAAAHDKAIVIVENVATHPNWAAFKALAMGHGLMACWSHPVIAASGEVLGTFALYYGAPRTPDPHHLRLVEIASHLAGIAIERERAHAERRAHTAALENQRAFVAKLIQDLPGGIAFLDRELIYRLANPTYATIVGRRPEDILDRPLAAVMPEAAASGLAAAMRRVIDTGEPFEARSHRFRYTDAAGPHETLWDYTLTPQRDRDGRTIGLVALYVEVTGRVEAERALQDANEQLMAQAEELQSQSEEINAANEALMQQTCELQEQQATIQGVMDCAVSGILVVEAVRTREGAITDFRFVMVNPTAGRMVGIPGAELIGHTLLEKFPGNRESGLFDHYVSVTETGRPIEVERHYRDDRLDFWLHVSAVRLGDGVAITFTDVTDRRRTEDTLRVQAAELTRLSEDLERQRRFAETLIERLPGGVAYIDRDFVFRVVNPTLSRFYGKPLAELIGRHVYDALPGVERDVDALYRQVRETLEPLTVEAVPAAYELRGETRLTHWDATIVPYLDQHGAFDGWLVLALEVSERQALQAERDALVGQRIADLERANIHKEQFLSILSHELRTPINAIMGFASVLDDGVLGPMTDAQHGHLGKILDGSDRLLALINDLLDMSRIQAGKFAITPSETAVARVCEGAVEALQPLAAQQGVTLSLEAADGLPAVSADPQRLEQVVTNMISNAIKFTPGGGTVKVAVSVQADHLRVEVRDTGMGIAPEHHARIFDAFTQVDMSNTRRSGGAGLGLAIAKSLIEAHQGQIGVESEEGRGSTFWFTVPRRGRPA